ncbi:hypothetical protein [Fulvivirga ligni]|uniref:hypothetical protein n=1 Tax=Fulvivirga ligni TaxID=2904246 RepID=UPI001F375279|nr:hypothetical protein [Fulvivirga ligni]UII19393.1 hypothetical protein LVD16_16260 [Fulvivirga ligni]
MDNATFVIDNDDYNYVDTLVTNIFKSLKEKYLVSQRIELFRTINPKPIAIGRIDGTNTRLIYNPTLLKNFLENISTRNDLAKIDISKFLKPSMQGLLDNSEYETISPLIFMIAHELAHTLNDHNLVNFDCGTSEKKINEAEADSIAGIIMGDIGLVDLPRFQYSLEYFKQKNNCYFSLERRLESSKNGLVHKRNLSPLNFSNDIENGNNSIGLAELGGFLVATYIDPTENDLIELNLKHQNKLNPFESTLRAYRGKIYKPLYAVPSNYRVDKRIIPIDSILPLNYISEDNELVYNGSQISKSDRNIFPVLNQLTYFKEGQLVKKMEYFTIFHNLEGRKLADNNTTIKLKTITTKPKSLRHAKLIGYTMEEKYSYTPTRSLGKVFHSSAVGIYEIKSNDDFDGMIVLKKPPNYHVNFVGYLSFDNRFDKNNLDGYIIYKDKKATE